MANEYFDSGDYTPLTRQTLARASAVNAIFAAIVAAFDKLPDDEKLKEDRLTYYSTGGSANVYTVTTGESMSELTEGFHVRIKLHASNTGASTINFDSIGAVAIKRPNGDNVEPGDLPQDGIVDLTYNGSEFRMNASVSVAIAGTANLADGSVTTGKLATGAVTEAKIGAGAVTEGKIGTGAVTQNKIGAGAVTAEKIGSGAVTTDKIENGAVTAAKLESNLVEDKIAGALAEIGVSAGAGLTGGGTIDDDVSIAVDFASQQEAEAGTAADKVMSPLRVAQAIAELAQGVIANVQTFTSSGTWTKPSGATWVMVELWGGGGGGGRTSGGQAGGGGGGGYSQRLFRASDLSSTVAVTVGAGGTGRTGSDGDGSDGGTTSFGAFLSANGGGGGKTSGAGGTGGNGLNAGGAGGAAGAAGGNSAYGGGGGGGGGDSLAAPSGGNSIVGGGGGAGGRAGFSNPVAGTAPGGGGGGGSGAQNGADGARGEARICSW